VSKFLLETISTKGSIVRSYRTDHLIFPLAMPDIWNQYGIKYTSSGSSNDQNTFLPFQLFSNRSYYQLLDVYEFSMTASDQDLTVANGCPMNDVWAVPGSAGYPSWQRTFPTATSCEQGCKVWWFVHFSIASLQLCRGHTLGNDVAAFLGQVCLPKGLQSSGPKCRVLRHDGRSWRLYQSSCANRR
jgi:hypothetical protein